MSDTRIYISGGITGVPNYKERFSEGKKKLVDMGYSENLIINPSEIAEMLPRNFTHADYMVVDLALLSRCQAIYMLKGWEKSVGARIENDWATVYGINIIFEQEDTQIKGQMSIDDFMEG